MTGPSLPGRDAGDPQGIGALAETTGPPSTDQGRAGGLVDGPGVSAVGREGDEASVDAGGATGAPGFVTVWRRIEALVDAGDAGGMADLVLGLGDGERRAVAAALPGYLPAAVRRSSERAVAARAAYNRACEQAWQSYRVQVAPGGQPLRDDQRWFYYGSWHPREWVWPDDRWTAAMRIAGAGTIGGTAAVTSWLNRRNFGDGWDDAEVHHLLRVLAARPPRWRADLATRAALRLRGTRAEPDGPSRLALTLLRDTGVTPPDHDPLVFAWVAEQPDAARLRDDPLRGHLLPRLFEAEGVGRALAHEQAEPEPTGWLATLTTLAIDPVLSDRRTATGTSAAEGAVVRDVLLDGCVRRFLRGGSGQDLRFFVRLHELLAPTEAEAGARARDYLRLLPDAPGPVARLALRQLRHAALDRADAVEAVHALLFRPERALVTSGLARLDRLLGREPTREEADELAPALAYAFACDSYDARRRAVRLAVRHARRFGPDGAETVIEAAGQLPPDLAADLAGAFGVEAAAEEPEPFTSGRLPPAPIQPPPAPPITDPDELRQIPYRSSWQELERWLDGVVRLKPALDNPDPGRPLRRDGVWRLVEGIARQLEPPGLPGTPTTPAPHWILLRRLHEVGRALRDGTLPPYLLATPTARGGGIDPDVLVSRLEEYERAGVPAMTADLQQALLRLPPEVPPAVLARAGDLTSEAGSSAARWMRARPAPDTRIGWEHAARPYTHDREQGFPGEACALVPEIRAGTTGLELADRLLSDPGTTGWEATGDEFDSWAAVLPYDRELVALHLLPRLFCDCHASHIRIRHVRALVLSDGAPGEAVATLIAYCLLHREYGSFDEGVRLLLDMVAAGDAPTVEIGRQLGLFLRRTPYKSATLCEALEAAAGRGAHREVWQIMAGLLPVHLPEPAERTRAGHTRVLAFAARLARWAGARGELPCVARVVERGGHSEFVREARRLHALLV